MSSERTVPKQLTPWLPGQSGNPNGRPKGSRNKLGEKFIEDLYADWQENGIATIVKVREEKPDQYLKVIASIVPKELHVKTDNLEDVSDDELIDILATLRSFVVSGDRKKAGKGNRTAAGEASAGKPLN